MSEDVDENAVEAFLSKEEAFINAVRGMAWTRDPHTTDGPRHIAAYKKARAELKAFLLRGLTS